MTLDDGEPRQAARPECHPGAGEAPAQGPAAGGASPDPDRPLELTVEEDPTESSTSAVWHAGDRVRVRNMHPPGHTRVPEYVRGHRGTVLHVAPPFKFPDASAHALPGRKEPTYHVAFGSRELWSESAEAEDTVVVDLWESYLEESS